MRNNRTYRRFIHPSTFFERLFEPEVLLPSQQAGARSPYAGEQRLALATMIQAARELQGKNETLASRARRWFRDSYGVLTFELACQWLGLDPDWLRPKILTGTLRRLPRHGSPFPPVSREWESSGEPPGDVFDDLAIAEEPWEPENRS
jgi:hypothetical protein